MIGASLSVAMLGACTPRITEQNVQKAEISGPEVKTLLDAPAKARKVQLLDPRSVEDFEKGHIPGAKRLDMSQASDIPGDRDPALEQYGVLVVYGDDPGTASVRVVAKKLMGAGYKDVRVYLGGLSEWKRLGYPVESGGR